MTGDIQKARNIIEELFYDDKALTQWEFEHLIEIVDLANIKLSAMVDIQRIPGSFNHDIISKIRNSNSDAEARRIISAHIKNKTKL